FVGVGLPGPFQRCARRRHRQVKAFRHLYHGIADRGQLQDLSARPPEPECRCLPGGRVSKISLSGSTP
ncbi:MAG TPA: hypothetical protein VH023_21695, partial [Rhodopila sp.]|nr:hypothetical protein [Rhodopila sp.]